eukprot:scaffold63946_cov31-Tisochrysis_lutea.AAC.4
MEWTRNSSAQSYLRLAFAVVQELPAARASGAYQILLDHPHLFIASGFSGFFVNVSSFLLVKRTSSITLKLITMARNGGLVVASAMCFGEEITLLEAVGYAGLLFFFGAYTAVKQQESEAAKQAQVEDPELVTLKTDGGATAPRVEELLEVQTHKPCLRRALTT